MDSLHGRTILITGAGDGIGRQLAQSFADEGANIVLVGRTREKLESVSDQIKVSTETDPIIVPLDLANLNEETARELSNALDDNAPQLDGLVHNASILGEKVPIEHYPTEMWDKVMRVNVASNFLLTQALLPNLAKAPSASVIFTSSGVGRKGRAYWGAYAVSKFATEGLMQVLADELAETTNIRVNSINPGATRTSMRAAAYPAEDPQSLPTPLAHVPLYVYLMNDESLGVTGQQFDAATWSKQP